MYGAVIGDIIGSTYERHNCKSKDIDLFPQGSTFTDDTVLSVAIADCILSREKSNLGARQSYAGFLKQYYHRYPHSGFGQMFEDWAVSKDLYIQRSYGNGAAMRVAAIGYAFADEKTIIDEVKKSCYYTHNNREAIKGACCVALAIFYARKGKSKEEIRQKLEKQSGYDLNFTLDSIREQYVFDSRTSYSVPPAIVAFLESRDYEDAVRNAISIGGDSDTIACMAGGIAEAYYGVIPEYILDKAESILDVGLKKGVCTFKDQYIAMI